MSREVMQQALDAIEGSGCKVDLMAAADALRAALAEQPQPAYWGVFEGGNLHDFFTVRETAEEMAYYKGSHAVVGPIYTTPPAPVVPQPLTDEDIDRVTIACFGPNADLEFHRHHARAVEAEVRKRVGVQR